MSFLALGALGWLAAVPALVWLWRLAASQHRVRVASLVPFESLLRRPPSRRTRLVMTALFWWQLAALLVLVLALLQPAWWSRPRRTFLVVMDTSASMAARQRGGSAFDRARVLLRAWLRRRRAGDQVFLVATAPVAAATAQPTDETALLRQAVDGLRVSHLSGNLASATHIGQALLGRPPDATLVVTDEPAPPAPGEGVTFISVGEPRPNTALVGLDAQGPLCGGGTESRLLVSVQRFAAGPGTARLLVRQEGRTIAQARLPLEAGARQSVPIALPPGTRGWVEVVLSAAQDSLAADDRAWTHVRADAAPPVVLHATMPALREVLGRWLGACDGLAWSEAAPPGPGEAFLLVTDGSRAEEQRAAGVLRLDVPRPSDPVRIAPWLIESPHPVAAYLPPLAGAVSLIGASADELFGAEEPVVWGLVEGRRVPLVLAGEHDGQRVVTMRLDPVRQAHAQAPVVAFFNSLRWLMARQDTLSTGEPLTSGVFAAGTVTLARPDGRQERLAHPGGVLRYETTTHAGLYRLTQGGTSVVRGANFFDPAESNLQARASTWQPVARAAEAGLPPRTARPLAPWLLQAALWLLVIEAWLYARKMRAGSASREPTGSGIEETVDMHAPAMAEKR
jgi:hypothetical protein